MKIQKKRIRSLAANITNVNVGESAVVALKVQDDNISKVSAIGFGPNLKPGNTVLPEIIGRVSEYNAEGREIIRKDLPFETAYRQIEWSWIEWHGREAVEKTDTVDVPYQRYPRDFLPPPSIELTLTKNAQGELFVVAPAEIYNPDCPDALLHKINLFLELFGECEILNDDLNRFIVSEQRRLNWEILPAGKLPWATINKIIQPRIEKEPKGNQPIITARFQTIQKYEPDFHAVGRAGFSGYVVFGFEELELYVLESIHYGNAIYVFDKDWEHLSKLTKAEILSDDLQYARIVHLKNWEAKLASLFQSRAA